AYGNRLEWTDFWQVIDVNNDGALDIVGHRTTSSAPIIYVNDGTGRFTVTEVAADAPEGRPVSWGDFDGDGKLEYVTFSSSWEDAAGTASTNRFAVFEFASALGTGPALQNAADLGAPAYNEGYYLNQNPDVKALVQSGQYASGLAHYLATGRAEGRLAIAPGTTVQGGSGNDAIQLREGNETAFGGAGNDSINGGDGIDVAAYAGKRAGFAIQRSTSSVTVADSSGGEGTDTLTGVERLKFADATVALDIDGNAGQAYRLYQAAFNRKPDLAGLGWQIKAIDAGTPLLQVSQNFMDSAEFKSLYGSNPSATTLVNLLYQNVLHRTPQQFEVDFWVGILNGTNSASHQTPAEVLKNFSESAENQAQVIGSIQNGIAYQYYA
ncbi:DUF4214 domain-containing protein, partial [Oxalobacteraceae bacterium OM1]